MSISKYNTDTVTQNYRARIEAFLKKVIGNNRFLWNLCFRLSKKTKWAKDNFIIYIVDWYSRNNPKVSFVQIGANDGVTNDLLSPFIRRDGWSGLLVEPMPDVFNRLVANYRDISDRLSFEDAAVGSKDEDVDFYYTKNDKGLPLWCDQIGSFDREAVMSNIRGLVSDPDDCIATRKVRSLTFRSLINKHNIKKVDLLCIDTEGCDHLIIRQIDFSVIKPDIVIFENFHISNRDVYSECLRLFASEGYSSFEEGKNTVALRGNVLDKFSPALDSLAVKAQI